MDNILLLDTATQVCSVVLLREGTVASVYNSAEPNAHSSSLSLLIEKVFADVAMDMRELDAVCVSSGPGSYTGLRIGVSSAKGICYALNIPLLSVPTLHSMAMLYYDTHPDYDGLICPMIDARRMECYTAIYGRDGMVRDTKAEIIESGMYDDLLSASKLMVIGDGAMKTKPILSPNGEVLYDDGFVVSAEGMAKEAVRKLHDKEFEDVAYFVPFYLKDFVAKRSEVHGLRK